MMKIMIFGLGSIGTRHARILKADGRFELYAYRSKKPAERNELDIPEIYSWEEVSAVKPEVAFITNPTFMHIKTALECASMDMKLFIEKPVDCSTAELGKLVDEVDKRRIVSYVAYNLRFHPVIKHLKVMLEGKDVYHASVYNSSYFAGWRPHQDHLKSYSASKEKGGGVILEMSHEFDYIKYLFGDILDVRGFAGRAGNVTLDAEDYMDAGMITQRAPVNLHIDFLSEHTERTIKVDFKGGYLFGDIVNSRIEGIDEGKDISMDFNTGTPETYKEQIRYFFDNIENTAMMNSLKEARGLFQRIIEFKKEIL